MKFKVLITVLILGLLTTANCQVTNGTSGNNSANATTNSTQVTPSVATPEETLTALLDFSNILDDSFEPQQVAEKLLLKIDGISNLTSNLNHLAMIMASKNTSGVDMATLSDLWNKFSANKNAIYKYADYLLENLESSLNKSECYDRYQQADQQAYLGITTLAKSFFSSESTNLPSVMLLDQQSNMSYYCENLSDATIQQWDDLYNILLGEDEQCDILMDVYNGSLTEFIWAGWRELVADMFGYFFLDVWFIQMTTTACQTLNGVANADQIVTLYQQQRVQRFIQRFQEFDNRSLSEVNETLTKNVQSYLTDFAGDSVLIVAYYMGLTVQDLYQQYDPLIFVFDANATSDQYTIQCDQCVKVFGVEGLSAVVAYMDKETTSSLGNLTNIQQIVGQNLTTAQSAVDEVFTANVCTSGVIAIIIKLMLSKRQYEQLCNFEQVAMNINVNHYIVEYLGDRFAAFNTTDFNVYVWGVQEGCAGGTNATNPGGADTTDQGGASNTDVSASNTGSNNGG